MVKTATVTGVPAENPERVDRVALGRVLDRLAEHHA
jgi:hypothetical protein